jgi:chromosome segregation ATPase
MREDAEWLRSQSSELWAIHAYNHVIVPMQRAPQIYNSSDRTLVDVIDSIMSHETPSHIYDNLNDTGKSVLVDIVNLHKEKLDVDTSDISSFDKYKNADKEILNRTRALTQNKNKLNDLQIDLSLKTAQIANTPFENEAEERKVKNAKSALEGIEDLIDAYQKNEQRLEAEIQNTQANLKEIEEKLSKNIDHLTSEEKKLFNVSNTLIPVVEKSMDACKKAYRETF